MGRRHLLLCFDAFGTLFKPKRPVPEQYAAVARQYGLDGFSVGQLETSLKAAFKGELQEHPNYGKASGMGAEKWWTNVIHKTFQPLAGHERALPRELAPRLLHRFASDEGYVPAAGVQPLLQSLKRHQPYAARSYRIVVGVITNSDDRVPNILSSLGFDVSPLRFGCPFDTATIVGKQYDIDLHCMSYDVGFAKPDRRIFEAAETMAKKIVALQSETDYSLEDGSEPQDDVPWLKLYVGDEFKTDVIGAWGAGWNSVLTGPATGDQTCLLDLSQLRAATLKEVFPQERMSPVAVRAETVKELLEWLVQQYERTG
ncbi:hypothetical protein MFIFM68171_03998 [Madurella fahalii]|uniref:Haloacid dehalogenase-like hydrolase domain-containing protein 3 n=1 Tax=Madurella fahalii TaxID=1157608 RepID=A0ABQ0G7Q7_9PEZI